MIDLLESVRNRCPDVDSIVAERHFHSLPVTYFERHAPAEIARHLRLIAGLTEEGEQAEFPLVAECMPRSLTLPARHIGGKTQ
jgi:hypothetical protein